MYIGNYTREEKMCPQGAAFLPYSLESVVSSERLSKSFDSLKKHTALSSGVTFYIYDWCVSRVLSWTVIYLERMLPYVSSRQSGRSGKP